MLKGCYMATAAVAYSQWLVSPTHFKLSCISPSGYFARRETVMQTNLYYTRTLQNSKSCVVFARPRRQDFNPCIVVVSLFLYTAVQESSSYCCFGLRLIMISYDLNSPSPPKGSAFRPFQTSG